MCLERRQIGAFSHENAPSRILYRTAHLHFTVRGGGLLRHSLAPDGVHRNLARILTLDLSGLAESGQQTRGTVQGHTDGIGNRSAGTLRILGQELHDGITLSVLLELSLGGLAGTIGVPLLDQFNLMEQELHHLGVGRHSRNLRDCHKHFLLRHNYTSFLVILGNHPIFYLVEISYLSHFLYLL